MRSFRRTWSGDPRRIEQGRVVHLEVALDNRSFRLAGPVFGTEQIFGIDFEFHPLKSGDADERHEHGHHKKVPGTFGHDVAEFVERSCQPFVHAFHAASHVCGRNGRFRYSVTDALFRTGRVQKVFRHFLSRARGVDIFVFIVLAHVSPKRDHIFGRIRRLLFMRQPR